MKQIIFYKVGFFYNYNTLEKKIENKKGFSLFIISKHYTFYNYH